MKWQDAYEAVIGLEIHAELKTASKMFCGCMNNPFGAKKPNSHTCPVCLGMPGGIPVPNKKAIEWTVLIGLATDCQINQFSKFDRKHYFYPDLAKGYQISQYDLPFCHSGKFETTQGPIRLRRIHLEEDTGKLLHKTLKGKKVSLIDFNRGGVPLVEIVTEPDIVSGKQAAEYGRKLRRLLRYLDVANCDMEQGGMRLEANISVRKKGSKTLPDYKVEIKNINSFRFMEQAIEYELERQAKVLEKGNTPVQETRGWDSKNNKTFSQRTKEEAEDYRYFPDPDIPPIRLTDKHLAEIKNQLPKTPDEFAQEWQKKYQLSEGNSTRLSSVESIQTLEWLTQIFEILHKDQLDANRFANDYLNGKLKVSVQKPAQDAVKAFTQLHTTEEMAAPELAKVIADILEKNPQVVKKYQSGEKKVIGFLMGQVMGSLEKKLDPQQVRKALQEMLS